MKRKKDAQARLFEEQLYEVVANEIARDEIRQGLMAKALVEADGNYERARAIYIGHRVQSLLDEAELNSRDQAKQQAESMQRAQEERAKSKKEEAQTREAEKAREQRAVAYFKNRKIGVMKASQGWILSMNTGRKQLATIEDLEAYVQEHKKIELEHADAMKFLNRASGPLRKKGHFARYSYGSWCLKKKADIAETKYHSFDEFRIQVEGILGEVDVTAPSSDLSGCSRGLAIIAFGLVSILLLVLTG